jgi:hypothetical protein
MSLSKRKIDEAFEQWLENNVEIGWPDYKIKIEDCKKAFVAGIMVGLTADLDPSQTESERL